MDSKQNTALWVKDSIFMWKYSKQNGCNDDKKLYFWAKYRKNEDVYEKNIFDTFFWEKVTSCT